MWKVTDASTSRADPEALAEFLHMDELPGDQVDWRALLKLKQERPEEYSWLISLVRSKQANRKE